MGLRQACAALQSSCAVLSVSDRGSYIILVVLCYFSSVQHQSDLAEALFPVSGITKALKKDVGKQDRIATETTRSLGNVSWEERWTLVFDLEKK